MNLLQALDPLFVNGALAFAVGAFVLIGILTIRTYGRALEYVDGYMIRNFRIYRSVVLVLCLIGVGLSSVGIFGFSREGVLFIAAIDGVLTTIIFYIFWSSVNAAEKEAFASQTQQDE